MLWKIKLIYHALLDLVIDVFLFIYFFKSAHFRKDSLLSLPSTLFHNISACS